MIVVIFLFLLQYSYRTPEGFRKMDNPTLRKGLDKITSSLNQIGDTFEKAFEVRCFASSATLGKLSVVLLLFNLLFLIRLDELMISYLSPEQGKDC